MAAKGSIAKEEVFQKMLETFSGSFMADAKTLRIPMKENGELIEIKVALTAAKDILGGGNVATDTSSATVIDTPAEPAPTLDASMSDEEKKNMSILLENLGIMAKLP